MFFEGFQRILNLFSCDVNSIDFFFYVFYKIFSKNRFLNLGSYRFQDLNFCFVLYSILDLDLKDLDFLIHSYLDFNVFFNFIFKYFNLEHYEDFEIYFFIFVF